MNNSKPNTMNIVSNENISVYISHTNGQFTKPKTYMDVCKVAGIRFGRLARLHHEWKNEGGSDMIPLSNEVVMIFK